MYARSAVTPHDKGSREDPRRVITARGSHGSPHLIGGLAHGYGLPRQRGLVDGQVYGLDEHTIGWYPVALGEEHQITWYDVPPRDAHPGAITEDQCSRGTQIAQRTERVLRFAALVKGDSHNKEDEGGEDCGIEGLREKEVDRASRKQEQKHGLPYDAPHLMQETVRTLDRKFVGPVA